MLLAGACSRARVNEIWAAMSTELVTVKLGWINDKRAEVCSNVLPLWWGWGGRSWHIITHCTPAETQNQPRGLLQMDRCICTDDSALLMLHIFLFVFFFLTWKILQLNAPRLYFPLVNFKRLLPLPLKASCALRLRFCALHSDEENPFLL